MGQELCLQYTHGVLLHLYKLSYQTVLPLVGVACKGQGTCQTPLEMYHFLPIHEQKELIKKLAA